MTLRQETATSSLHTKLALITGGNRGLGRKTAIAVAQGGAA